MILSVDTSLGSAVAVVDLDGTVRSRVGTADRLGHAEVIGDLLVQALADAGNPEITHVAAGMGPGPFTGLRIGIAAARTFALARDAVLVPVVSHDAIALAQLTEEPDAEFAVVTDARRRELAYTLYTGIDDDGLPVREGQSSLTLRAEADDTLAGWIWHEYDALDAGFLGMIAARAIRAGRIVGPAEPLYLRSPDVAAPKVHP